MVSTTDSGGSQKKTQQDRVASSQIREGAPTAMGVMFFTLISYVPSYRIEGRETFSFAALLWVAWRVEPAQRKSRQRVAEPTRS